MKRFLEMSRMLSAAAAMVAVGTLTVASISDAEAAFKLRLSDGAAANTVTMAEGGMGKDPSPAGSIGYSGGLRNWLLSIANGLGGGLLAGPFPGPGPNSLGGPGGNGGKPPIVLARGGPAPNPPVAGPPASNPPATNPPAANPPATNPPVAGPLAKNPPAKNPPAANPPAVNPPATNPPAANPPAANPPVDPIIIVSIYPVPPIPPQQGQVPSFEEEIQIPEPGSLALFGVGLLGLGYLARRRKARRSDV